MAWLTRLVLSGAFAFAPRPRSEMNLTRLRYFVVTAEEECVVRAAGRLRVAQPALSRQLQALEREVGTPLFERHARGVRLRPAGAAFLEYARRVLEQADAGIASARRAAGMTDHPVVRMSPPDWPHRAAIVATAVERLRDVAPDVVVQYESTPWLAHAAAIQDDALDIGFAVAMDASEFGDAISAERLKDEPASSAVIAATHPLARRTSLTLGDLRDIPTLIPSRDVAPLLHDQMVGTIRRGGYEPRTVPASANFSAAAQMVVAGAGWILSVCSVGEHPPPGTAVIPITDASVMLGFFLLRRRGDQRPAVRAFVDCVRAAFAGDAP